MSNELVKQAQSGGLLALMENLDSAADRLMTETGTSSGIYFQFSGKTGQFSLSGQPIDPGTVLAFNLYEMKKGVICWADSKPIHRETVPVLGGEAIPAMPEVADRVRGHQWNTLIEVDVRTLDDGTQATFGISTAGGVAAITRLFKEYATKARMFLDDNGMPKVPLIEIGTEKKSGKDEDGATFYYFKPIFKLVDWAAAADLKAQVAEGDLETGDEPVEEAAPAPAAKPAVKPGFRNGGTGRRV